MQRERFSCVWLDWLVCVLWCCHWASLTSLRCSLFKVDWLDGWLDGWLVGWLVCVFFFLGGETRDKNQRKWFPSASSSSSFSHSSPCLLFFFQCFKISSHTFLPSIHWLSWTIFLEYFVSQLFGRLIIVIWMRVYGNKMNCTINERTNEWMMNYQLIVCSRKRERRINTNWGENQMYIGRKESGKKGADASQSRPVARSTRAKIIIHTWLINGKSRVEASWPRVWLKDTRAEKKKERK